MCRLSIGCLVYGRGRVYAVTFDYNHTGVLKAKNYVKELDLAKCV